MPQPEDNAEDLGILDDSGVPLKILTRELTAQRAYLVLLCSTVLIVLWLLNSEQIFKLKILLTK